MKRFYSALLIALIFTSVCSANQKVRPPWNPTFWDDLRFSADSAKQGTNDKPAYNTTELGLAFPVNDETHIIYINAQMPHKWAGTAISPHIHFTQTTSTLPVFVMAYRWYNIGSASTANLTVVTTNGTAAVTYTSGSIHQLIEFPDLTPPASITGVSSMLDIKIYRQTGDGAASSVIFKEFDIHYEIDQPGSRTEYVK